MRLPKLAWLLQPIPHHHYSQPFFPCDRFVLNMDKDSVDAVVPIGCQWNASIAPLSTRGLCLQQLPSFVYKHGAREVVQEVTADVTCYEPVVVMCFITFMTEL